jgi:hypothetical protein
LTAKAVLFCALGEIFMVRKPQQLASDLSAEESVAYKPVRGGSPSPEPLCRLAVETFGLHRTNEMVYLGDPLESRVDDTERVVRDATSRAADRSTRSRYLRVRAKSDSGVKARELRGKRFLHSERNARKTPDPAIGFADHRQTCV